MNKRAATTDTALGSEVWILSFCDLLLLLLTFFVFRVAFSFHSLKLNGTVSAPQSFEAAAAHPAAIAPAVFSNAERALPSQSRIVAAVESELFQPGTVELSFQGQHLVEALSIALKANTLPLFISVPVSLASPTSAGESPWSLATARAYSISRQMIDRGVDRQALTLSTSGLTRSKVLVNPNLIMSISIPDDYAPEQRAALLRRMTNATPAGIQAEFFLER